PVPLSSAPGQDGVERREDSVDHWVLATSPAQAASGSVLVELQCVPPEAAARLDPESRSKAGERPRPRSPTAPAGELRSVRGAPRRDSNAGMVSPSGASVSRDAGRRVAGGSA